MNETKPQGEVGQGLSRLQDAVNAAHEVVGGLESKITSILETLPEEANKDVSHMPAGSTVGRAVHDLADDVENLVARIKRISSRVVL